jgi:predicted MPP superfamily phosphohydrolase
MPFGRYAWKSRDGRTGHGRSALLSFQILHTGSHTNDLARLHAIIDEVSAHHPDLVLFGGDYVDRRWIAAASTPPRAIAAALARVHAPLGRYAVLGNHDYAYDGRAVTRPWPISTFLCSTTRFKA